MARPVRMEFSGALYHITSPGNARQAIFFCDENRARLSRLPLRKIGEHYGLSPSGVTTMRRYLAEEKREDRRLLVGEIVKKGR